MTNVVIGIDEVGRGSLAGPVTVAAVALRGTWRPPAGGIRSKSLGKLRDSKKLSPEQRENWNAYFMNHPRILYAIANVHPRRIEKINVSRAANAAALRAFKRLIAHSTWHMTDYRILLDGGLYLGNGNARLPGETIIKADERFVSVKIASIIAKVHRDQRMVHLGRKYPEYGFEVHKGYGTAVHRKALMLNGPSDVHRLTFLRKYSSIAN